MHNTERFRNRFIEHTVRLCVDIPPAQVATCITCVTYRRLHIYITSMVTSIIVGVALLLLMLLVLDRRERSICAQSSVASIRA